jgi:hypothetical protein
MIAKALARTETVIVEAVWHTPGEGAAAIEQCFHPNGVTDRALSIAYLLDVEPERSRPGSRGRSDINAP